MARTPFTLRIDAKKRAALENLSKIEGRSVNQIMNEAIKGYLLNRDRKERSLEANLAGLRACRKQDPGFRRTMDAFMEAEVELEDPLEGEVIEGYLGEGRLKPTGPVQSRIRDLLDA